MGETLASKWLEGRGFGIEARNYRCRMGEVDLVCRQEDLLVFVEVKARKSTFFGEPAEAIGARKRERIVRAASRYLLRFGANPPPCRFDVVEVLTADPAAPRIRHIPDAFRPGWR